MTDLDLAIENIGARIRTILQSPSISSVPDDSDGPLTNLSHLYRMRGIAKFLRDADVPNYVLDLQRSVQTRSAYLAGCARGASCSPKFFRTTRNRAFFDALAVNNLTGAAELAEGCDGIWVEKLEYEDDFLLVDYLQKAFLVRHQKRPASATSSVLARYEQVLPDSEGSPFYRLCRALEDNAPSDLESALEAVTLHRASNYAQLAALGDLPQVMLHTERFLDVQGIGILRMATDAGLNVERTEYPRIPAELVAVAHEQRGPLPPNSWNRIS